ncbi:aminotransferase class V-fold PLP-dependent enzyme [Amycolatopsis cihanbeyliensis]|uniref:Selenocysteine lyase/cysteine desulfurase n=1 Tax=Amycolatopsis cihanbeyliensis TaxID=1128664 RepID=A0A542CUE7_AMYCI|nr:aminotransferase class V-fold PLP-dependent enzyme [Amycolatopsis cihanbeyliensis]TQI94439.1 selenocysteine lyase/cysteine desulfurase [Amycolatopsis cihanbeyliensis]
MNLDSLRRTPNALAAEYSRFRVGERLLLTGHSHQAWPDVAREGQLAAFEDAARDVDAKWEAASRMAEEVRVGVRALLADDGDIALGVNTHELLVRFLSSVDIRRRPRLVTTDGEFHSARRQLARLAEEGIEVVRVPAAPAGTLAERLAAVVDDRTAAVLVSAVLFETARIVPGLDAVAAACRSRGAELVVDAYHALGVFPLPLRELGLGDAWVLGGGYKYLQLGEGNCFLRLPPHAAGLRPVVTGWFAEFGTLAEEPDPDRVVYARGGDRFAGATYDPTSHYRAARVLRFRAERGLTPEFLRTVTQHQLGLLADRFDRLDLPESVITRDRGVPLTEFAGFLALRCRDAAGLRQALAERGVSTDSRGEYLRLGPAPYLSDAQLESAIAALATCCA